MIPLTTLPLIVYHTRDDVGRLLYLRGRYALLPPGTPQLSQTAARAAENRSDERSHGVPVLVYQGIGRATVDTDNARFVVSRQRFAEQLRSLRGAGYEAITTAQLARYLRTADPRFLPAKPVLITFDDGRADVMLQVDRVLRDTDLRATMFIVGKRAESGGLTYADWGDLKEYADSGEWEIGSHTYDLHELRDRDDIRLSALVDWKPGENLGDYRGRLTADLDRNQAALLEQLGAEPVAFAYPYGDAGRLARAGALDALQQALDAHFDLAFEQQVESGWRNVLPGDDPLHIARLAVEDWTGLKLLDRLEAAGALAEGVYEERALGYDFTSAELLEAASGVQCPTSGNAGVVERRDDLGDRKLVALTFDDGPSVYTPQILDVLRSSHAVATFFVLGSQIEGHERLLQRTLIEGSEIGNHGMAHRDAKLTPARALTEEVEEATRRIGAAVPLRPCVFRPPLARANRSVAHVARAQGMRTTMSSLDALDVAGSSPVDIAERVLEGVKSGAIVRLHDGGGVRWATVQALPIILAELDERGFETVTVSQLLAAEAVRTRETPQPSQVVNAWMPALVASPTRDDPPYVPVAQSDPPFGPVAHERQPALRPSPTRDDPPFGPVVRERQQPRPAP